MKTFTLSSRTHKDHTLSLCEYAVEQPRAIVQVVHGMEEHKERYEDFALFLNSCGYTVITADLCGHGSSVPKENIGFFSEKNGYQILLQDVMIVRNYIRKHYPDKPVYLFAHSMGTIISRVVLQKHSADYDKVVLSGYPNFQYGAYAGIFLSSVLSAIHGPKYKSKLLQYLSVGSFNRKIAHPRTDVDWICANPHTIEQYLSDPLCGIGFTTSAFHDLYRLVILMHNPRLYQNISANLPFLLISGNDDPCTGGKKGRIDSVQVLQSAGFQNITSHVYPNMRHEILNEHGHTLVYEEIKNFFAFSEKH